MPAPVIQFIVVAALVAAESARGRASGPSATGLPARAVVRLGKEGPGLASVAASPDGSTIATADVHGTIRVWRMTAAGPRAEILFDGAGALSLDFSPDGRLLAAGSSDGNVRLWVAADGKLLRQFPAHPRETWAVRFSPDGRALVTAGGDGAVHLWDVERADVPRPLVPGAVAPPLQGMPSFRALALSPDGSTLAWSQQLAGPILHVWDPQAGREIVRLREAGFTASVVFSPDGATLVTSGNGGRQFNVWETASWRLRRRIDCGGGAAEFPAGISGDGRCLWTVCGLDVYAWDLSSGRRLHHFAGGHQGAVTAAATVPHGRRLISGGADGTAVVWELAPRRAESAPSEPLPASSLEQLWSALAAEDAASAYDAAVALEAAPSQVVPYLRNRLPFKPPLDEAAARRTLAELDHDDFTVREQAARRLAGLGDPVEPLLRGQLAGRPSPEAVQRIEMVLEALRTGESDAETVRSLRAVEVLERVGTPAARAALKLLAEGAGVSRVSRRADAAVGRIDRLPPTASK